ncbi:MAG: patatin-like phospholipase family protein [Deltaproteobacteria bacterium]|nr:patatin-like phospholipase family protein [Deltaproteobacteria bacterium]
MRILNLCWVFLLSVFFLFTFGCAHYPVNPPLSSHDPNAGYRYKVVRDAPAPDRPFVLLAFSGGGTRAAAFSFGLMEELRQVEYQTRDGSKRKLLDDVEIISSVSGGSFTSAYYALYPDEFYTTFPDKFLYRNIQGQLVARLFNPYNLIRLASPEFSRIDMAEELYRDEIFGDKTFGDLINNRDRGVPFLVLNATDIGINHRFEFTQDQFDLVCSDLSDVSVARAVAASSNFPVAFAPLTVNAYKDSCGALPDWINLALRSRMHDRRYADAVASASYRDPESKFVHLLDGGLSDNLGLRGPLLAITTTDSPWSILQYANLQQLDRLMVIAVNAKTSKKKDWNEKSKPPGIDAVLDVVMNGPMDDVSFDSVENVANHFNYMEQLARTVDACNHKLGQCPEARPIPQPIVTDFTFAELSFDRIDDPHLRRCLQELPTSFKLPRQTVDLLRVSAARLLMTSESFKTGMQGLDPEWTPREVQIDPQLVDAVCGAADNPEGR